MSGSTVNRQFSLEQLSDGVKEESTRHLQTLLYSGIDLYLQIKESHWTLAGREFLSVHRLFDGVAEEIENTTDDYAERIAQLGHKPLGTVQVVAAKTLLTTYPESVDSVDAHVELIARRLADFSRLSYDIIKHTDDLGDLITSDLVTGRTREIAKLIWLVESHLPPAS